MEPCACAACARYTFHMDIDIGAKNENLKNLLKTIYTELGQAQNQDTVKEIAKTYNTGNIINVSDNQTPKPDLIKIIDYYNTNVTNYSYETLNNKLEALEKENQDLKKELEYISEALDDKLQRLDEINKIFELGIDENADIFILTD